MRPAALLGIIAVWFTWGINWPIWKVSLGFTGPIEFMSLRSVAASILLVVVMLSARRSLVPHPIAPLALMGLLQGVGMNGFSVLAVKASGATTATIFAYTMPFWTVIFARLILHEEIRPRHWIAIAIGMAGLGVVAVGGGSRLSEYGAALAVSGAICWALGTVVWKWTSERYTVDPMVMVTWQNLFSIAPLAVATWFLHEPPIVWAPFMIFAFAYNVLVTAVISWFLWYWLVRQVPAVTAGMSSLMIPAISIVTASIFIGEHPAPAQWLGIAAMLLALAVVTHPGRGELDLQEAVTCDTHCT